jgi:hypothetical protein
MLTRIVRMRRTRMETVSVHTHLITTPFAVATNATATAIAVHTQFEAPGYHPLTGSSSGLSLAPGEPGLGRH